MLRLLEWENAVLNDILKTALQSLASISILFALTKLMGRKQISQLNFFDYIIGISIGSIAASFAVETSVSYASGVTALILYAIFPIVFSFLSLKSFKVRKFLDGVPVILMQNGHIIEKNLKKVQLTINDFLEECRQKNVFQLTDIELAILEADGKMSILLKAENQPVTPKDMKIEAPYKGLCMNVIIDGNLMDENLRLAGKDENWIKNELINRGYGEYRCVLLAYIDSQGRLILYPRYSNYVPKPLM